MLLLFEVKQHEAPISAEEEATVAVLGVLHLPSLVDVNLLEARAHENPEEAPALSGDAGQEAQLVLEALISVKGEAPQGVQAVVPGALRPSKRESADSPEVQPRQEIDLRPENLLPEKVLFRGVAALPVRRLSVGRTK